MATTQQPSIRDLIAELADTEDVLRGCRGPAGPRERSPGAARAGSSPSCAAGTARSR